MNGKGETFKKTWRAGFKAIAALCLVGTLLVGCHDDDDYWYSRPDLVDNDIDDHYVSALSVAPGDVMTVGLDVRSRYNSSDDFVTRFYLSYNDTITDNDVLLATYYSAGLDDGERERQWVTFTVPNVLEGRYYLGAIIDERDDVNETNERNNVVEFRELIDVVSAVPALAADEVAEEENVPVVPSNFPPFATAANSDVIGAVGQAINLTASGSGDPDGDAVTYSWIVSSLPDGANADAFANVSGDNMITQFTPDKPGTYVFVVTVSDGTAEATDAVTILVE